MENENLNDKNKFTTNIEIKQENKINEIICSCCRSDEFFNNKNILCVDIFSNKMNSENSIIKKHSILIKKKYYL